MNYEKILKSNAKQTVALEVRAIVYPSIYRSNDGSNCKRYCGIAYYV